MAVPEDKLFWERIREATVMCELNHEREIEFTIGSKKAIVVYDYRNILTKTGGVVIVIEEVPITTKEALIVP